MRARGFIRHQYVFVVAVAALLLGAVVPIVAEVATAPPAGATLPLSGYAGGADYSTTMTLPADAPGFRGQTYSWTVLDEPTWQDDLYFYANQGSFSNYPNNAYTPVTRDGISTKTTTTGSQSAPTFTPDMAGDQIIAFLSGPGAASGTVTNTPPAGKSALNWIKIPLPAGATSVAIFAASNTYDPATPLDVTATDTAGASTTLSVEAYAFAGPITAANAHFAFNKSAGGGASGSGAPSVTVSTTGAHPSIVAGVGYDPTSARTMTPASGQVLDKTYLDTPNHASLWVQSQTANVTTATSVTLSDTANANDAWEYAGLEVPALGSPGFYTGIQPDSTGNHDPKALFSYFGGGIYSIGANCVLGADGGTGVSCGAPITWVVGHKYANEISSVNFGIKTTWTATNTDVTAGTPPVTIGSWTILKSTGQLNAAATGFAELYGGGANCASSPYARLINHAPTGIAYNAAQTPVTGKITKAWSLGTGDNGKVICPASEVVSDSMEISTLGRPRVSPDGAATVSATSTTSATITPNSPSDLLVASVATVNTATVTVTSPGLTWTNVQNQHDSVSGNGGLISTWTARAGATFPASATTVTSTLSGNSGAAQILRVAAYAGASGVGQTAFTNGSAASAPSLSITPQQTGSWIATTGYDADSAATVTAGSGQTLDASVADNVGVAQGWFQHSNALTSAGTAVTVGGTLSPAGVWDLGAIEIMPVPQVNFVSRTAAVTTSSAANTTVSPVNNNGNVYSGDVLVATVATTNLATVTVTTPTGPTVAWTNVANLRDPASGDGGLLSVWVAEVPKLSPPIASIPVRSTISGNGTWKQTLVVTDFNGVSAVGATASATGSSGTNPSVNLTPNATGSWIATLGFDGDSTTTVGAGANQVVDAGASDAVNLAQAWFGHSTIGTTSGQTVTLNNTLSPGGHWGFMALELTPVP